MTNKCVVAVITSFCAFERLRQVNKGGIGVQVFCPSGASRKYHTCYTPVNLKASMVFGQEPLFQMLISPFSMTLERIFRAKDSSDIPLWLLQDSLFRFCLYK